MALFEWTLLLLMGSVILAALARRLGIPYPALLAVAGAILAFLPFAPKIEIDYKTSDNKSGKLYVGEKNATGASLYAKRNDEKRVFLEDKLARDVRLFFTHDHACALAQVTRDDRGRFGTTAEQASLHGEPAGAVG